MRSALEDVIERLLVGGFRAMHGDRAAAAPATMPARANSYAQTATACPRFMEGQSGVVGIRTSAWQWLMSSLERPVFSEPKSSAALPLRLAAAQPGGEFGQRQEFAAEIAAGAGGGADHQRGIRQ